MAYIHNTNLYTIMPRSKALHRVATIITARWVDINTGDAILEHYRPRLVAREVKNDDRPDLVATTPPLAALNATI